MFVIRRAKMDDADTLLKLAKMVHFINLPPDREIIAQKVVHSRNSFLRVADQRAKPEPEPTTTAETRLGKLPEGALAGYGTSTIKSDVYMFVLEDTESPGCLGSSQVVSRMGGPGSPIVAFQLEDRSFFSESLQTGTKQIVAKMHFDESGPAEIGGLILQPSFRGHKRKLGRFLSLIRFHFMGLHRELFARRVLAEMMAPISPEGESLLWEYLGRRFVPLSYDEADRFCQYSREFITALLPHDEIYLSLLPPAARQVIGQVGKETVPARKMLERLGFQYTGIVDPFDGGPYLYAERDLIPVVQETQIATLGDAVPLSKLKHRGIVSVLHPDGEFYAVDEPFFVDPKGRVCLHKDALAALKARPGDTVGFTPFPGEKPVRVAKKAKKKAARRAAKKITKKTAKKKTAKRTKKASR